MSADSQKLVYFEEDDSIDDMKKLILEEVNLFRSEVTATAQLKEDQLCVSHFRVSFSTTQCAIYRLLCLCTDRRSRRPKLSLHPRLASTRH